MERIRQKKYNEYVRAHHILTNNTYRYQRSSCVSFLDYRSMKKPLGDGSYTLFTTKSPVAYIKKAEKRAFVHQGLRGGYRVMIGR